MAAAEADRVISPARRILVFLALVSGTVLGLSGIDLVLPAIPTLPEALGGTTAMGQWVIASYIAGGVIGFWAYGALAARFGRRRLLLISQLLFAASSFWAATAPDMTALIALRFVQGIVSASAAVFAPAIIRRLFSEGGAIRAIGMLGSIEALVPALAPIAGAWLYVTHGWQSSFHVTGAGCVALACITLLLWRDIPHGVQPEGRGSYRAILRRSAFWRYALGHALVLGGLLVFVFGAPVVIVNAMGGALEDFIIMQIVGVSCFIVAANAAGWLVDRLGAETVIWLGNALALAGTALLVAYSVMGPGDPQHLLFLFPFLNVGLGIRGPISFLRAIQSGEGDDDRASSLTVVVITLLASLPTALIAPLIGGGLVVISSAALVMIVAAVGLTALLPKWEPAEPTADA